MSPMTASLLLWVSALLTVCGGLPSSSLHFPGETEDASPRLASDHRWRRSRGGRTFYFPGEQVETVRPPVTPELPHESEVIADRSLTEPDGGRATSEQTATGVPSEDTGVVTEGPTESPSSSPSETTDKKHDSTDHGTPSDTKTEASAQPTPVTFAHPATGGDGSGAGDGSAILFPDSGPLPHPIPQCGGELFHAYNNATDDCHKLWTDEEAGCANGTWFVVDPVSGDAACRPRPCAKNETHIGDACWPKDDNATTGPCNAGQGVFEDHFGEGYCDCLARQVYWPAEDRCYPVYQQGPCPAGEHLVVPEGVNHASCRPTPCPDGQVFWGEPDVTPFACYAIDGEPNPCPAGQHLAIDIHTLQVHCVGSGVTAVFDIPKVRCPAGSQLDFNGECRDELVQDFRTSFAVLPENRSLCASGLTASPDGRCISNDEGKYTGLGR